MDVQKSAGPAIKQNRPVSSQPLNQRIEMLKPKLILILFLFLQAFTLFPHNAYSEVTEGEIGRACVETLDEDAQHYYFHEIIPVHDNDGKKDLILLGAGLAGGGNTGLIALLRSSNGCDIVLSATGRDIKTEHKKGKGYPDIEISYSTGRDEETSELLVDGATYFWNGKEYEDVTFKRRKSDSKKLNEKALGLFKRGKIDEAIRIWEKVDGDVINAEILTNLGFAYYTLGKKTNDTRYFSYDAKDRKAKPTPFEEAHRYLNDALVKEPKRWSTLLNLGDLFYETNEFVLAIINYEKLLEVKPDYKHSDVIKNRIEELKRKLERVGVEMIVTRFRTGEKGTTYTRLDANRIQRCNYYKNGKIYFCRSFVDWHETNDK